MKYELTFIDDNGIQHTHYVSKIKVAEKLKNRNIGHKLLYLPVSLEFTGSPIIDEIHEQFNVD